MKGRERLQGRSDLWEDEIGREGRRMSGQSQTAVQVSLLGVALICGCPLEGAPISQE